MFQEFISDNGNYLFTDIQIAQGSSTNWSYPTWPSHLDHILVTNELFSDFQNPNSNVAVVRVDDYMNSWNNYENNISDHRPVGLKLDFGNTNPTSEVINNEKIIISVVDALGRDVETDTEGIIFYIFEDGEIKKIIR